MNSAGDVWLDSFHGAGQHRTALHLLGGSDLPGELSDLCSGINAVFLGDGLGYFSGLFIMASYGNVKILLKTNPE